MATDLVPSQSCYPLGHGTAVVDDLMVMEKVLILLDLSAVCDAAVMGSGDVFAAQ